MPPFSQNGAISAFLGLTETVEIPQPLINFFDKDLTNAYLVIIPGVSKKVSVFDLK